MANIKGIRRLKLDLFRWLGLRTAMACELCAKSCHGFLFSNTYNCHSICNCQIHAYLHNAPSGTSYMTLHPNRYNILEHILYNKLWEGSDMHIHQLCLDRILQDIFYMTVYYLRLDSIL